MIEQYQQMANRARSDAAAASLTNVQQMHLKSAQRWEEIISGLKTVAQAKVRNEDAKRVAAADL